MNKYEQNTRNFLNAVVNPFGASDCARVPDRYSGNTVCLTDWIDYQPATGGDPATGSSYLVTMILPNYSSLKAAYASSNALQYQVVTIPLTAAGVVNLTASNQITSNVFQNYSTITGSTTTYDDDECLVDFYRIYSMGLRQWPAVEMVTDTSVSHILRFYGGMISPAAVYRSILDGTNLLNIIKQSDGIKSFPGYQGCTVRWNPFDQDFVLEMMSLVNHNQQARDFSGVPVPVICAAFSKTLINTDTVPLYTQARVWLEGQLSLPTPIYSNASPIDYNYNTIAQYMSRPSNEYPFVTEGHSFAAFTWALSGLPGLARTIVSIDNAIRNKGRKLNSKSKNKTQQKSVVNNNKIKQNKRLSNSNRFGVQSMKPPYAKNEFKRVKNT